MATRFAIMLLLLSETGSHIPGADFCGKLVNEVGLWSENPRCDG